MNDEELQENYALAEKLIAEQNFAAALIGGAVATLLAAAAYGITVATWAFSYGFAAAGIGIVIGLSMRYLGRGISTKFTVVATVYTITGCVLGNLFRVIVELAVASATSPVDVIRNNSLSVFAERSVACFSLVDLVYWFVAVFCAVFLARKSLSRSERLAIGLAQLRG
jgi:dipeptide/tripeptide permease